MAAKVPQGRYLIKAAIKDFWLNRGKIIGAIAVIALPLTLLSIVPDIAADSGFKAYNSFLNFITISGLIWLISQIKNNHSPTIGEVYYVGTGSLVKFMLLGFVFFMMALPFLLGNLFYVQGLQGTLEPSNPEKLLLGIVWAVLSLPSIWLLTRFILAVYALIDQNLTPFAALRSANRLVKGKMLKVFGRLITLFAFNVLILSVLAFGATFAATAVPVALALQVLIQLISILVLLPIANFYLFKLYRSL